MKYLCAVVTAILAVLLGITSKRAMAQPLNCMYASPENRQLCLALASLYADSFEGFESPVNPNFEALPPEYRGKLKEYIAKNLPQTKRQDVEHVFLRFGRRR